MKKMNASGLIELIKSEIIRTNDVTEAAEDAVDALAKIGATAIPAIEGAIEHNRPSVRRLLIEALEKIGEAALPALGRAFESNYYDLPGLAEDALFRMDVDPRKAKAAAAKAPLKHEGPKPGFKVKPMGSRRVPVPGKQKTAHRRG
jgi:HEAT repeat protein